MKFNNPFKPRYPKPKEQPTIISLTECRNGWFSKPLMLNIPTDTEIIKGKHYSPDQLTYHHDIDNYTTYIKIKGENTNGTI